MWTLIIIMSIHVFMAQIFLFTPDVNLDVRRNNNNRRLLASTKYTSNIESNLTESLVNDQSLKQTLKTSIEFRLMMGMLTLNAVAGTFVLSVQKLIAQNIPNVDISDPELTT